MRYRKIDGRIFLTGKIECGICEEPVRFTFPVEVVKFWIALCEDCDPAFDEIRPHMPNGIVLSKMFDIKGLF